MSEPSKGEILQIDLVGNDPELFKQLSSSLTDTITNILGKLSDTKVSPTTSSVVDEIVNASRTYVEAKLKEPSIKNQKLLAEITELYAETENKIAAARETNAKAEKVELENIEKRLELAIKMVSMLKGIRVIETKEGLELDVSG